MEYEFKAVTKDGQRKSGVKDAMSQTDLARGLRDEGYFLVWSKEKNSASQDESKAKNLWSQAESSFGELFKRVSLQEKMIFRNRQKPPARKLPYHFWLRNRRKNQDGPGPMGAPGARTLPGRLRFGAERR